MAKNEIYAEAYEIKESLGGGFRAIAKDYRDGSTFKSSETFKTLDEARNAAVRQVNAWLGSDKCRTGSVRSPRGQWKSWYYPVSATKLDSAVESVEKLSARVDALCAARKDAAIPREKLNKLSDNDLDKLYDKVQAKASVINRKLIDAGHGQMRPSDMRGKPDPLFKEWEANSEELQSIIEHQRLRKSLGSKWARSQS